MPPHNLLQRTGGCARSINTPMNILFLGLGTKNQDASYETQQFIAELKNRNHTVFFALWSSISFLFTHRGVVVKANGVDLKYFDYIIPRYPLSSVGFPRRAKPHKVYMSRLYRHYVLIVDYINQHNKHILNERVNAKMLFYDKLFQHYFLSKRNIPIVDSFLYTGHQFPESLFRSLKKPFIAKKIEGSRGLQIHKVRYKKDIKELIDKYGQGNILIQKYLQDIKDYRVIVINDKVVGGIERIAKKDEFRANVALGATTRAIDVPESMKQLAVRVAKVFNAEFTGVDIVEHKGKYYVLEVNIFPMFEGFQQATNINVPAKLAEYIEQTYLWNIENLTRQRKQELFDYIYNIEKHNEDNPFSKKQLKKEIETHDILVVTKSNKPIAYAAHFKTNNTRIITRLIVTKQHRGQRIGRRMLQRLVLDAKKDATQTIRAEIARNAHLRIQSFKRAKFKQVNETKNGVVFEYVVKK